MDEFALIRRYFAGLSPAGGRGVQLGIGDDCALLEVDVGQTLAVTTDTLVSGRHFLPDADPESLGWKSLAVNLSDLAAMGAVPRWITLALTLEHADADWLAAFARGLGALAAEHNVTLVGGDMTRGPLSIMVTAMGAVPPGQALRRSGARAGDVVCVTGTLGDAALALREPHVDVALNARLHRPTPRVQAGLALRSLAHAAIDLSDGLAGDLSHVLQASGVGADVWVARLPRSAAFAKRGPTDAVALQVAGGDDYELCVCLPPERVAEAQSVCGVALTEIGRITPEPGLRLLDASGATMAIPPQGYRHFT